MKPPMREVHSSNVAKIGHNMATGELVVEWRSGRTSAYSGVPADLADEVSREWSVGEALAKHVKPYFKHRYLDKDDE